MPDNTNKQRTRLRWLGASTAAPVAILASAVLADDEQPPVLPGDVSAAPVSNDAAVAIQPISVSGSSVRSTAAQTAVPFQTLVFSILALLFLFSLVMSLSSRRSESKRLGIQLALFFGLIGILLFFARGSLFPNADQVKVVGTSLRPELTFETIDTQIQPSSTVHVTLKIKNNSLAKSSAGKLEVSAVDGRDDPSNYQAAAVDVSDLAVGQEASIPVAIPVPASAIGKLYIHAVVNWQISGKQYPGRSEVDYHIPITSPRLTINKGYNMVSLPYLLSADSTADVFLSKLSFNKYMYWYDPTLPGGVNDKWVNGFDKQSAMSKSPIGQHAYILYTRADSESVSVPVSATSNSGAFYPTILKPGWNMVSNPYPRPVSLANATIHQFPFPSLPKEYADEFTFAIPFTPLGNAQNSGEISTIWFLTNKDGKQQYDAYTAPVCDVKSTDANFVKCVDRTIPVGQAIWIKNKTDHDLKVQFQSPREPKNNTSSASLTAGLHKFQAKVLYGDVNNDGKVDSTDALLLLAYVKGNAPAGLTLNTTNADLSPVYSDGSFGDSQLTLDDVDILLSALDQTNPGQIVPGMTLAQLLAQFAVDTAPTYKFPVTKGHIYGDANQDGKLDMVDVSTLNKMIRGEIAAPKITDTLFELLDIDSYGYENGGLRHGDGKLNDEDAITLISMIQGDQLQRKVYGLPDSVFVAIATPVQAPAGTGSSLKYAVEANAPSSTAGPYGDANGDRVVNILDGVIERQYATALAATPSHEAPAPDSAWFERLDLAPYDTATKRHGDGKIDLADVNILLKIVSGGSSGKGSSDITAINTLFGGSNKPTAQDIKGDLNHNQIYDISDSVILLAYLAKVTACKAGQGPCPAYSSAMDIHFDGVINQQDNVDLLSLIASKPI